MNTRMIARHGGASLIALLAVSAPLMVAGDPLIPANLMVPATQRLSLAAHAIGVQIYDCKASKDDPGRYEWVLRAPEADLFDESGQKIGRHYAGPTWESNDGSKAVGEVKARDDGPDANAIPWLLMTAKSTSGDGILGRTVSVQRVETVGGKAPSGGCGQMQAARAREARVPYSATYNFFIAAEH